MTKKLLTREDMIDAILEDVENWDHEVLINAVKDTLEFDMLEFSDVGVLMKYLSATTK